MWKVRHRSELSIWIIEYANEWVDDVLTSQFSINFVHRNDKNPIFQLWESNMCTLNKYKMFAVIYFDMGACFYFFEPKKWKVSKFYIQNTGIWKKVRRWHHQLTHLHIHINCSRNVLLKITKFHIFLILYPIYIKFSLFCLNFILLFLMNLLQPGLNFSFNWCFVLIT